VRITVRNNMQVCVESSDDVTDNRQQTEAVGCECVCLCVYSRVGGWSQLGGAIVCRIVHRSSHVTTVD